MARAAAGLAGPCQLPALHQKAREKEHSLRAEMAAVNKRTLALELAQKDESAIELKRRIEDRPCCRGDLRAAASDAASERRLLDVVQQLSHAWRRRRTQRTNSSTPICAETRQTRLRRWPSCTGRGHSAQRNAVDKEYSRAGKMRRKDAEEQAGNKLLYPKQVHQDRRFRPRRPPTAPCKPNPTC